ncbi:ankyrin repeat-containing domain protein, partial [Diaporthe sp. PMI_573]
PDVACRLDSMNRSTLYHAACGGDDRIISVVAMALKSLTWAPTVDYPDDNGLTPLHVACREGYSGCVGALLDLGASPLCTTQSAGLTAIHYASLFGHYDCLKAMAEH